VFGSSGSSVSQLTGGPVSTLRRCLVGLALSAATAALVPFAPALADEPWPVPDPATITITGDGFGHGHGMSQYGAYGAARDGMYFKQILRFYYPGTKLGRTGGQVRVLISADDDRDLVVDARPGLTAHNLKSGRTWKLDVAGARRWRIRRASGRNVISYRTSSWHTWRTVKGDAELAAGGKPVGLHTPDGVVAYRGALRSTVRNGARLTVNVLSMESYLRGVVAAEMYPSWPTHALRAQAVASRTYAAYEREHTTNPAYDLCDTAACQAYGGRTAETSRTNGAVRATAGTIVTYRGETAFAQFSASDGGWTVAGQFDYLPAQEDPHEGTSPDYYGWAAAVSDADVEKAYNIENLVSVRILGRDGNGGRGGRVEEVELTSSTGWTGTVTGESFRRNLGLKSTMFEISEVTPAS
jgi:stage II sporulation protein D